MRIVLGVCGGGQGKTKEGRKRREGEPKRKKERGEAEVVRRRRRLTGDKGWTSKKEERESGREKDSDMRVRE